MNFINPGAFRPDVKGGHVIYWPIVLSILWPLAFIAAWSGPFSWTVGVWFVLLFWGLSASVALVFAIDFAAKRNWLRVSAMLPLPLTIILAIANFGGLWRAGQIAGDYVHFYVMRPIYLREISKLPSDGPRLVVYNWGGLLPLVSHGVAYDESDEVGLPKEKRSAAWQDRANRTDAECIVGDTPLGSHFYLVNLDC
jgi:hypothetical protein